MSSVAKAVVGRLLLWFGSFLLAFKLPFTFRLVKDFITKWSQHGIFALIIALWYDE